MTRTARERQIEHYYLLEERRRQLAIENAHRRALKWNRCVDNGGHVFEPGHDVCQRCLNRAPDSAHGPFALAQ